MKALDTYYKTMNKVYLPFWVVLEYLDQTPPEAFIPCFILKNDTRDGITYHELALYKADSDLKAYNIPAQYVIEASQLVEWGQKISTWFVESAKKCVGENDA